MQALVQTAYGTADVLEWRELELPAPGPGQVRIRVIAASLAAGDRFLMHGTPFPARFATGFPRPKKDRVVGLDFAGVVDAVGPGVDRFGVGEEVYGECLGSCAEYTLAEVGRVARKPRSLSFGEAAAVPTSGCTALQALRDSGKVAPGHKVLINGASGGVGPFAVQIAKAMGAEVTAVCSTGNVETMQRLGADRVIDYTREDFTTGEARYDVILDNVASHSLTATRRVLAPGGIHVPSSGHGGLGWLMRAAATALVVRSQGMPLTATTNTEDLDALTGLIDAGTVRPLVDRVYPLPEAVDGFRYLDEGHARGKIVIAVVPEDDRR